MMDRRDFLKLSALAPAAFSWCAGDGRRGPPRFHVRTLTRGPKHHFFGYR